MQSAPKLAVLWGVPVKVRTITYINWMILWGFLSWYTNHTHPERTWWVNIMVGFLASLMLLIADWGHAFAHILSARYARAPMDEIVISGGMPRTHYSDNEVSPETHRLRALGGPIFSAIFLLISLLVLFVFPGDSLVNEIGFWSSLGHAFIFIGCLIPIPIVDGGTILKWSLVKRGRTPDQADIILRRVNIIISILSMIGGIALLVRLFWLPGLVLIVGSGIILAAAFGKIK